MKTSLRVVGIGASAGGLEALEQLFAHANVKSGMAYILVQHLAPDQKSLLSQILQKLTSMSVIEASDGLKVVANSVYVNPPDSDISVKNGCLHLVKANRKHGLSTQINKFLFSLARDQRHSAIAVILSGMGNDGALGLQAIKEAHGITAVQTPESASYDSMPINAIKTQCVDIISKPETLLDDIQRFIDKEPVKIAATNVTESPLVDPVQLDSIISLLKIRNGHDFSMYRSATLTRRVERRMAIHRCVTIRQYNKFLQDNQQESDFLFKEILIGVTSFFRDPMVWDYLSNKILPTLMDVRQAGHTFRIWCAGCSTGEEAYTIGMIFSEIIEKHPDKRFGLKIFGTDVSDDAITAARLGVYTKKSCSNINEKRLEYFFDDYEDSFKVNQNLRKNILFAVHDVTKDPPFTKLDMIFCRNLLIYFDPILQKKLIPKFHHCLLPAGYLLLGSAETIGDCSHLFTDIHAEFRCYQHIDAKQIYSPVQSKIPLLPVYHRGSEPLADICNSDPLSSNRLQLAADHILLQVFAPAAVVVNTEADIVYISGHTGTYLEPAAGKANWNFLAMAREGIRQPIALALKRLSGRQAPLHIRNLFMQSGTSRINVKVTLQKLYDPAVLRGMTMIVFEHTHTKTKSSTSKKSLLNPDLTQTQHNQQSMEEIQSLREEVHSSNLDLINSKKSMQSANEQLQSANEELMTSKEEMQSMNEELQTINSELQSKLDDLELAKSDMQNVLNSVDIAILFLDKQLNIRRFTDRAQDIIQLRDSDLGRPLSDLNSSLRYPQLHIDAASTLSSLVESEKEIFTTDQRCYLVRIIPYHRLDNVIDGVVITLQDITANKKDEIHENQINCDH